MSSRVKYLKIDFKCVFYETDLLQYLLVDLRNKLPTFVKSMLVFWKSTLRFKIIEQGSACGPRVEAQSVYVKSGTGS